MVDELPTLRPDKPFIPTDNSSFITFNTLAMFLFLLTRDGKDKTPEADGIRNASLGHWEKMNEAERTLAIQIWQHLFNLEPYAVPGPEPRSPG